MDPVAPPPAHRETVVEKAHRYLAEGRLTLQAVDLHSITAQCRGDGRTYFLGWDPMNRWHCSCPAAGRRCCHLIALRLVCIVDTPQLAPSGQRERRAS